MTKDRDPAVSKALEELFDVFREQDGIQSSAGVRKLINALWANGHAENPIPHDTALLTGMATGLLLDYAKRLEEEGR